MLGALGHSVSAEAGTVQDGSSYAMTADYDLAILDINLHGVYVDPVADLVLRRGKPLIFATGYGPETLPSLLRRHCFIRKPVSLDALNVAINRLFFSPAHR